MAKQYWKIQKDAPVWRVAPNDPHTDNVEMSGLYVDEVLYYGVREDGEKQVVGRPRGGKEPRRRGAVVGIKGENYTVKY